MYKLPNASVHNALTTGQKGKIDKQVPSLEAPLFIRYLVIICGPRFPPFLSIHAQRLLAIHWASTPLPGSRLSIYYYRKRVSNTHSCQCINGYY